MAIRLNLHDLALANGNIELSGVLIVNEVLSYFRLK